MSKAKIKPQNDIENIFRKPGHDWSEDDRNYAINWLYQDPQSEYLFIFALKKLGYGAQPEDAEDVLYDFHVEHIDSVINSYDPDKGFRFWNYLLKCFERECIREGQKIRNRHKSEISLTIISDKEKEFIEFELEDTAITPEEYTEYRELLDTIKASRRISVKEKTVFELFHINGLLINEIALRLNISVPDVKISLHRAKNKLAADLQKKGW